MKSIFQQKTPKHSNKKRKGFKKKQNCIPVILSFHVVLVLFLCKWLSLQIFSSYVIENSSSSFYIAKSNAKDCNRMGYYPEETK